MDTINRDIASRLEKPPVKAQTVEHSDAGRTSQGGCTVERAEGESKARAKESTKGQGHRVQSRGHEREHSPGPQRENEELSVVGGVMQFREAISYAKMTRSKRWLSRRLAARAGLWKSSDPVDDCRLSE